MNIKYKAHDNFSQRVDKLIEKGIPEREAVNAIKAIDYELKHDPKKYIQPFVRMPNGTVIPNRKFHEIYGNPDKPFQNVGKQDYHEKLENDKEIERQNLFNQGKFKSYGISKI
jgi:hypothetical protein